MSRPCNLVDVQLTHVPELGVLNGGVSHWIRQVGVPVERAPLPGDISVDVAIVGGGMTGLWTSYYLKKAQPDLSIAVLERRFAGFGASGRNGGWLSAEPPGLFRRYARDAGVSRAKAMQREMFRTVDEVLDVLRAEGVDVDGAKDGLVYVATNGAQRRRIRARFDALHDQGWDADDLRWLEPRDVADFLRVDGAAGGYHTPHCARVNPAKLTLGLARIVEQLGVTIYEGTTATDIQPRRVRTDRGEVTASFVVRAVEGYTGSLSGERRTLMPMNSSMVVTDPLSPGMWDEIGWQGAHLVGDGANSYAYMQRTADGRIAIGGRGVPYNFASRFDMAGRTAGKAIRQLRQRLTALFPVTRDLPLHHSWTGVLGVPRDWCASVNYQPASGLVTAGGYVGHGVAGTNLAARTVRDLILGHDSELTALPWVGHRSRRWEPEPLRWVGASTLYAACLLYTSPSPRD